MTNRLIRVLWTANIDLPAVAPHLGLAPTPFGGWLSLMTERLAGLPDFQIGIAMRSAASDFRRVEKNGIVHFALPQQSDKFDVAQTDVDRVLEEFQPDILHIEGAEMRHALRFLSSWKGPSLLSMQGILNGYAPYVLGQLPILAMLNPLRPRLMMTAIALLAQRQLRFQRRLASERSAMRMTDHISGRTLWDRAQAKTLAPHARYHHCARILRDEFQTRQWQAKTVEAFSIFVGNGAMPRKGVHVAVQALSLLVRDFPDARLNISGEDPRRLPWRSLKRHVGYPVYLLHLVHKLGLERHVHFTGVLSGPEMAERMARSHVCLMASIIENSPNTLGEAMMLGAPVVSAYAGGAPSMARDEVEALFYRPDDPAMLAFQIRRIFEDPALAARLGRAGRRRALRNHDPRRNLADLVAAYKAIMDDALGEPE